MQKGPHGIIVPKGREPAVASSVGKSYFEYNIYVNFMLVLPDNSTESPTKNIFVVINVNLLV